ncbi:hypothetical protein DB313_05095 (plasmid) [Borrelia turcica IST7]|uniref:Uncharacterized protein n=1 Tax=Borrelia turcica IST7 TaxID=1104446 RepID=A0A386PMW3_9SPIR|nr:hypothetical protein [Borrelia turcica]AYE36876.1 hypothetical protein DB313_05095 [Borrelia turcica IST7]
MRYVSIVSILVLVFVVGCKQYEFETEEDEIRVAEEAAGVAEAIAGEVSKLMGLGAEEMKALSQEDLEKLSGDAKNDSEKSEQEAKDGAFSSGVSTTVSKGFNSNGYKRSPLEERIKKTPALIKAVKDSAEKFEKAFKALVSAGYSGGASGTVSSKLEEAVKKLALLSKVSDIAHNGGGLENNDNNKKREEIKKELEGFAAANSGFKTSDCINGTSGPLTSVMQKCVNKLMGEEKKLFDEIEKALIKENTDQAQDKFSKALKSLSEAAKSLGEASRLVAILIASA